MCALTFVDLSKVDERALGYAVWMKKAAVYYLRGIILSPSKLTYEKQLTNSRRRNLLLFCFTRIHHYLIKESGLDKSVEE